MEKLYKALFLWPWTPWVDVCTFTYGSGSYLVQGKTNRITNARKFRCVPCDGHRWAVATSPLVDEKKLAAAGMFTTSTKS